MLERIRALVPFDPARQRLVLINPNASELLPHRRWMPERFAELIGRILAAYADVVVMITGAPEERARAEELARANGPRSVSFAGQSSLTDLPALYAHAALMVTNDSGPAPFFSSEWASDHRAVRPGDAETLPAARHVARDLCRARLFALRYGAQSSQDRLHR